MAKNFPNLTQSKASRWGIDLIALSGWGVPEIEKIDFKKNEATFLLRNSTVARELLNSNKPVDHLFRGLLAGGMSFGTKTNLDAIETHCVAKGDKICKFHVMPSNSVDLL
jgi:predicted hydrocarbon binding protein